MDQITPRNYILLAAAILFCRICQPAFADFTTQGAFTVSSTTGFIGIGTTAPGQMLDIKGTLRTTNFIIGSQSQTSGFQVDSNGNVGIGTTLTTAAALTVMNGNVGIGTWVPGYALHDVATGFIKTLTANKSTFMEVSFGTGSGSQTNFSFGAAFTKVNFHALTGYTLTDLGGNYSAANDWYVAPVTGTYLITTKLRVTDSTTANTSYGQGSGTSAADGPTFLWLQTNTASRNGSQNVVMKHYTAGSNIIMFAYANSTINASDGDFSIFLLTAD